MRPTLALIALVVVDWLAVAACTARLYHRLRRSAQWEVERAPWDRAR